MTPSPSRTESTASATGTESGPHPSAFMARRVLAVILLLAAAVPYLLVEFYLLPMVIMVTQDHELEPSRGFQLLIDLGFWRLAPLICFLAFGLLSQLIPNPRLHFMSGVATIALILVSLIGPVVVSVMQYVAVIAALAEL